MLTGLQELYLDSEITNSIAVNPGACACARLSGGQRRPH